MVMNEDASAPVVSATSRETPTPLERASAYCPSHAATKPAPRTGHAVVGGVVPAAHLLEAKHEFAELLLRASKGMGVALGGGWGVG